VFEKNEYNWSQWWWLRNGATSGVIDINHPEPITTMQRMLKFTVVLVVLP
jgi:hypothetical protein